MKFERWFDVGRWRFVVNLEGSRTLWFSDLVNGTRATHLFSVSIRTKPDSPGVWVLNVAALWLLVRLGVGAGE